jgi:hypothetical protein
MKYIKDWNLTQLSLGQKGEAGERLMTYYGIKGTVFCEMIM